MKAAEGSALETALSRAGQLFEELRNKTLDPPGVTRATYGQGESIAHGLVADWATELDLERVTDYAGNLYITLPGRDRQAPRIMIGSHLDSVPHGGNYDGAAGVIAGMVALHRLRVREQTPEEDVTVMAIRAEEACWFSTHYAGSRMAFGVLPPESLDDLRRTDTNRTLAEHMAEQGFDPQAVRKGERYLDPERIRAFIEPHIEQGPVLIGAGLPLGIVTAIRGNLRYKHCKVIGTYSHAGAVPRGQRHDAVFAAVEFARALEQHWLECEQSEVDFLCTMGEFYTDATQHTMTKIAGDVRFTMDMRSEDNKVLMETDAFLRTVAKKIGRERRVNIDLGPYSNAKPAAMDVELRRMLKERADSLGIASMDIASGAGHDCATFADQGVPSAMIFIRNENTSHNPDEHMEMGDFAQCCRLLNAALNHLG